MQNMEYCSWGRVGDTVTVEADLRAARQAQGLEPELPSGEADKFRDAINQQLPEGVRLLGNSFYGPAKLDPGDVVEAAREAVSTVNDMYARGEG